ncbi:4Fe-4S dicluster domain-containing protein [Clostridium sp. P21]|uniref:4Fe-4S dicluster domain-containing protein n=1 Tax=Clostridium muellerianum TaxID=2716538 RepID=A0A7Y0HR92_9CLOT|nr:4Fe-4S dicluster domain-containing protein [Clostridium muellerianum]NMM65567.1 4Fe-4S dicluster domain-containing protein [Clostridium muellerianum]
MKRKIVSIDEKKCNGCGLCIEGCHEGAIELINGKAKLVSDEYCDGLGDCLPHCPTDAIEIIERESKEYDEEAVKKRMAEKTKEKSTSKSLPCGCPGTMAKKIERKTLNIANNIVKIKEDNSQSTVQSQLSQWPVQLKLVNPNAQYFKNANLLIAADCTAYAYANFHNDFIKNHITVIGCPKLDDNEYYKEKLAEIIKNNNIKSIIVVRMEVPCCGGIVSAVKGAMLESQTIVPYREVTISTDGNII